MQTLLIGTIIIINFVRKILINNAYNNMHSVSANTNYLWVKVNPHFTLFDPSNMIPTLGNRGLPNSAMLCCQPRATSISSG